MGMMKEFRDFAVRGNVVDMAVGVVIGGAFGKIISSLVENIIMPPIGMIMGGVDFSNRFINLGKTPVATLAEAKEMNVPVIAYGQFFNTIIDFLIIAFVIFLVIRQMNRADAKSVLIFALSADAFVEDERRSIESGMNGHYAKPVDFTALQHNIGVFLREKEKGLS